MMKRRTAEESQKFASNPGSRWYQKMHGEVLPDGTIELVKDEVIDIQAQMNAEYPSTTIDNILANSNPQDYFGDDGEHGIDALNMPKTLAEFMQFQIDQKYRYDSLPAEIKERFGNDFNKFLATAGSEEWLDKLGVTFNNKNLENDVEDRSAVSGSESE